MASSSKFKCLIVCVLIERKHLGSAVQRDPYSPPRHPQGLQTKSLRPEPANEKPQNPCEDTMCSEIMVSPAVDSMR